MDGPTTSTVVTIRSSDGIGYPIEKQTLLQNTSYFNSTVNNSNSSEPITINLVETARVLGPLIQFLNPQGLIPSISLFGFESIFAVFQAALKYGFTSIVEKTREDIKAELSGNTAKRDLALRLAIECGDQEMIRFISELIKGKRSSTNGTSNFDGSTNANDSQGLPSNHNQDAPPPTTTYRGMNMMGNPEKPEPDSSFSSAFETLAPRSGNPESNFSSSITINGTTPASSRISMGEKNNDADTIIPGSTDQPGSGKRPISGLNPTSPMQLPVSYRFPVEYATVFALQEFLRMGKVEKKNASEIAQRQAAYERAVAKLKGRVLAEGTGGEKEWAEVYQSILEEAEKMEGMPTDPSLLSFPTSMLSGSATPTTPVTPITPPTPNSAARLSQFSAPAGNDRLPTYNEAVKRDLESGNGCCFTFGTCIGSACYVSLLLLFPVMLLAGLGTELGLSIKISQGLQEMYLDPSLSIKMACKDLTPRITGKCHIPTHWSLGFAYCAPIIAIATCLWTWCCDAKVKYKFTAFMVSTTIASVVGTTQLATKGYGADNCNTCPDKEVYVPLRKLRDMNRGQAAGAWFIVIGWVMSIIAMAAAAD